jgi:hypothetical protein
MNTLRVGGRLWANEGFVIKSAPQFWSEASRPPRRPCTDPDRRARPPHHLRDGRETPLPGPFYIVNFGPWKDCFLAEASTNIEKIGAHHKTARPIE